MQNFTTFTEVDVPGRLMQDATRSSFTGLRGDDADIYLYKAIVSTLTDFTQEFEFYIDAADPTGTDRSAALVSYVQDLDDWEANRAGSKNQISVMVDLVAAGPAPRVAIVETNGTMVYTSAATYSPAMDTLFYCTFVKLGADVTLYIYSDSGRTTLVATLTLTLQAAYAISYVMAPQSNGSGDADEISGYIQDMDDPQSSKDLYGYGVIKNASSAELYASFSAQTTVELYGHAIIRDEISAELYASFEVNQSSADLYGHGIIQNASSVELYGHTVIRHVGTSQELYGDAIIRDASSAELYGDAIIQGASSAELYGYTRIKDTGSAELYGYGIIRDTDSGELYGYGVIRDTSSVELYGYVLITRKSSAELYGDAVIKNASSAELYGDAVIKNASSAELYGHAIIRHESSAELYGYGIIRNIGSAELYGYGIIRNIGSAELYTRGIVRNIGSVELLCGFRLSTDKWIVQGVSAEAYIELTIVV